MKMSPAIQELIDALRHLPGVGPKSAQRMTLHLLERDREAAESSRGGVTECTFPRAAMSAVSKFHGTQYL